MQWDMGAFPLGESYRAARGGLGVRPELSALCPWGYLTFFYGFQPVAGDVVKV